MRWQLETRKAIQLMFGKRPRRRPTETLSAPVIRFVGEQDGPPERELKQQLVAVFKNNPSVQHAYLAQVVYADASDISVCLCIKPDCGDDPALVKEIGEVFAVIFRTEEHLDILFIRDDQEAELKQVCEPFYAVG